MKELIFNIHDMVLVVTFYLCVLFAILLFSSNESKSRNYLLALFLLCQAFMALETLVFFGDAFNAWAKQNTPGLFYFLGIAGWLESALLFIYIRSMIIAQYRPSFTDGIVFLPVIICIIALTIHYSVQTRFDDYISYIEAIRNQFSFSSLYIYTLDITRVIIISLCLWQIQLYRNKIKEEFSNIEKIDYTWLRLLAVGFLVLWLWPLLIEISFSYKLPLNFDTLGLINNYLTLILVSSLLFFSLRNPSIVGVHRETLEIFSKTQTKEVSPDKKIHEDQCINDLLNYIEKEKPFTQHQLKIGDLANALDLNPRLLSTIINKRFDKNFFEFINDYRVEEAKRLLASNEHQHLSILDIMYESGFNTKASFNNFFKKKTGTTPRQYRNEYLKD